MKIQSKTLILITKSNFGGAQRFVLEQAIKLKKEGSDVLVVFGGNGNLKNHLEECEISYLSLANLEKRLDFKGDFMILLKLLKIYRSENPSEIYLNSSKMGFLGSLAGVIYKIFYFKKIKIYFTVHGWVFNEDLKKTTKFLYKLISYWTILNCNKVFVLSKFEFNQMKNWPWAKNKLETIKLQTNVLESDFIPKENARDYFAKNLGLNKNKKWIVTIAEINSNKNLSLGIKALKEIKEKNNSNFIWIIIGEGENYEKIAKMIEKYSLKSHIFLFGYLRDAYKYLKAFDMFLLTSKKEGVPYVLLEAELAGLDIISTKVGGIEEYFDKENNILIENNNKEALVKALIKKFDQ